MVGLMGDLPSLDFPLWLYVSEQLGTVASYCTLTTVLSWVQGAKMPRK